MLRAPDPIKWSTVLIAGLYLSGIYLWGLFFNWGDIPFGFHDWLEVNIPRLAAVQDAERKNVIPFHFKYPDVLRCGEGCDRYFSSFDEIVSPDILLLKWMPIGSWVLLHMWICYSAGFWGILALQRRFKLSMPLLVIAYLLFFFNGHILAHLSVGHITWGGYFLLPWFVYLVDRFVEGDNSWAWVLKVALLLLVIFLQGSYHQFVWALIFLGFLSLVYYRRFFTVLKALGFACLVAAFRILPPVLSYNGFSRDYYDGYPNLIAVYVALTHWVPPAEAMPLKHFESHLGYWEFDLFIGKIGLAFLLLAGVAWLALQIQSRKIDRVLIPIAAIFLLAYDGIFAVFRQLPIPLLYGERSVSRMISLALVFFIFLSIAALQKWVDRLGSWKWVFEAALVPVAIYQAVVLIQRLLAWRVTEAARVFPYSDLDLTSPVVNNHADPVYFLVIGVGVLVSALSIGILVWLAKRNPGRA